MYNELGVMPVPTEKPRFCITVDKDMLKKIDDFRFENRIGSRSQATVELIRMGVEYLKREEKESNRTNTD